MSGAGARFDWYEATFEVLDPVAVAQTIAERVGGSISGAKGRNGYALCAVVEVDGHVLARVFYRCKRVEEVHVEITGAACDDVVPVLREVWPDHRVSRVDSAVDFAAEFEQLDKVVLAFAEARGLKHRWFANSDGGATRYLGARSSEVQMRVYKKTEELRARYPHQAHEVPDGIVRVEITVRPNSKTKGRVSTMTPDEIFGLSKWGQAFAAEFLGIEAERVPTHFREVTDWNRLVTHLAYQYGPAIQRRAAEVGPAEVLEELAGLWGLSITVHA